MQFYHSQSSDEIRNLKNEYALLIQISTLFFEHQNAVNTFMIFCLF